MLFEVDGLSVSATTGGRPLNPDLPLMVMVHGAALDKTVWQLQTRYFAHHGYSVLAVDLPGHGSSSGGPLPQISDYADWLARAIVESGYQQAHLVGHSMGSLITLETAARHPNRASTLIMLGGALAMPVHPHLLEVAEQNQPSSYQLMTSWGHGKRSHLGGHQTPGIWMTGATLKLWERAERGLLAADLNACNQYRNGAQAAQDVQCPTLLIVGSIDIMTPPSSIQLLQEALADHEVVEIKGAGHSMMIENPDQTIDAISSFLSRRG